MFGKGAMRGAFQAGVVHAFVLSGKFPRTVAGTSIGAISGATLVIAARLEQQADRMALVRRLLHEWRDNPGRRLTEKATDPRGSLRRLAQDLLDIRLDLDTAATLATRANASAWALLWIVPRAAFALPWWRPRMALALFLALLGVIVGHFRGNTTRRALQGMLSAYGMRERLLPGWVGERLFDRLVTWLPRRDITLDDLGTHGSAPATTLLVQVANLSRPSEKTGGANVFTVPGNGRLEPTLRAAVAMAPVFAPVPLGSVLESVPSDLGDVHADDVLMDAAEVEKMPLATVIGHWRRQRALKDADPAPKRLFVVHHTPNNSAATAPEGYIDSVLRSLELSEQRDTHFNQRVTKLVTQLTKTIEDETQQAPSPPGLSDQRYVQVDPVAIAPARALPPSLSIWSSAQIGEGITEGCRATLSALHGDVLRELGETQSTVPCATLLRRLRADHPDSEGFFEPSDVACADCPRAIAVPPAQPSTTPTIAQAADALPSREEGQEDPLVIAVPAGGVFRGVFQVGSIAALRRYGIRPELFAGASVGTLFSYLMEAMSRPDGQPRLRAVVDLMQTIPEWVDGRTDKTPGRVDYLADQFLARWRADTPEFAAVAALHSLRPGHVVELLRDSGHERWRGVLDGLNALLLYPVEPLSDPTPAPASAAITPIDQHHLLDAIYSSLDGRYGDLIALGDRVLHAWGVFTPGHAADGEVLGFESVATELRKVIFDSGGDAHSVKLEQWSTDNKVRFLLSGAHFERGTPEVFGRPWDDPSADTVEAALAASSFPVAFRRRRHAEVFGTPGEGTYVDGGVFNNFPSDIAFAFLRRLSATSRYQWLGKVRHRVLLLSLDPPTPIPRFSRADRRALMNEARARDGGRDDKVYRTWVTQQHITHLAAQANPILRSNQQEQAMRVDFDLVEPVAREYNHAFAFKSWLGFRADKQQRLLAAGCRRARIALEWREFRKSTPMDLQEAVHVFNERIKKQLDAHRRDPEVCIFGQMTPTYRRDKTVPCCAFVELHGPDERAGRQIQSECRSDARNDPPLRPLPIYDDRLPINDESA